jgi:hypothetical protein
MEGATDQHSDKDIYVLSAPALLWQEIQAPLLRHASLMNIMTIFSDFNNEI